MTADPLAAAAASFGIAQVSSDLIALNAGDPLRRSGAELLVLANVSRLLSEAVLSACPRGSICFHPSLLPRHRGKRAVAAAIKAGDTFTGVSIFWPDKGADTGPIILRSRVEIASNDTPMSLYHAKLVPVGIHCLLAAVAAIEADAAPRIPQEEAAL
ncbi:MAG: hypothetical protein KF841_14365 [Phycisphaerae bacterium]|nr:hypothetical protein [Phycisphaerae bacterium]